MYTDFESILELMGPQGLGLLSDPFESPNPNPNQPMKLINTHHLVGVFVANLLMEMLIIH